MVSDLWLQTTDLWFQAHPVSDLAHSQDLKAALRFFFFLYSFPPPSEFPKNLSRSASHNPSPWMGFLSSRKPTMLCRNCSCFKQCSFFPRLVSDSQRGLWPEEDSKLLPLIWGLCPNPARAPSFASSTLAHLWPHPHSLSLPLILHHLAHTHVS